MHQLQCRLHYEGQTCKLLLETYKYYDTEMSNVSFKIPLTKYSQTGYRFVNWACTLMANCVACLNYNPQRPFYLTSKLPFMISPLIKFVIKLCHTLNDAYFSLSISEHFQFLKVQIPSSFAKIYKTEPF